MITNEERKAEFEALRKLEIYGWYIRGARRLLLEIMDVFNSDLKLHKSEGATRGVNPQNKAIFDMLLDSKIALENFMLHNYDEIRFKDFVKDKKGRLIGCKAYLGRRAEIIDDVTEREVGHDD